MEEIYISPREKNRIRLFRNRALRFLLVSILLTITGYMAVYLFSVRDLSWHLRAVPRIMLIPVFIGMLLVVFSQQDEVVSIDRPTKENP